MRYIAAAILGILAAFVLSQIWAGESKEAIYYFYADWCPHCQAVKPYVEEAAKKINITFCNIDNLSDRCKEIAEKVFLQGVPTIVEVKDNSFKVYVGSDEVWEFLKKL